MWLSPLGGRDRHSCPSTLEQIFSRSRNSGLTNFEFRPFGTKKNRCNQKTSTNQAVCRPGDLRRVLREMTPPTPPAAKFSLPDRRPALRAGAESLTRAGGPLPVPCRSRSALAGAGELAKQDDFLQNIGGWPRTPRGRWFEPPNRPTDQPTNRHSAEASATEESSGFFGC